MSEKHTQNFKGYWIPVELQNVGLCRTEQFLLSMIDSLDSGKPDYCYASNEYLATQLEVSASIISRYISNLKKLKFIEEISFTGRVRRLKSLKHNWYLSEEDRIVSRKESYAPGVRQTTHEVTGRLRKECEAISNIEENKETTTEEPLVAAVFTCLEQTSLSASEKQSVMKLGIPEPRVALAVEYATHPRTAIKKDLISTIVWHCKLEVPATPPEETAQEKALAENKRQDELREIIEARKYKTRAIIQRDWKLFHVKPNDRVDTVEFGDIKIYYSDKNFEERILKAFADSKKIQT